MRAAGEGTQKCIKSQLFSGLGDEGGGEEDKVCISPFFAAALDVLHAEGSSVGANGSPRAAHPPPDPCAASVLPALPFCTSSIALKSTERMRRKTGEKKSSLNPAARATSVSINTSVSRNRLYLLQLPKAAEPPRPS